MTSLIDELGTLDLGSVQPQLSANGIALVRWSSALPLLDLAREFGTPVASKRNGPIVDELTPKPSEAAYPRSLSGHHGLGEFPWHTDGAHWRVPPRYVLLRLVGQSSERTTRYADTQSLRLSVPEFADLKRLIWLTNGGRGRHLTPLINDALVPGSTVARFDPHSLVPAHPTSERARELLERALSETDFLEMHWVDDLVLVADNWRWIHARSGAPKEPEQRVLERVWVVA